MISNLIVVLSLLLALFSAQAYTRADGVYLLETFDSDPFQSGRWVKSSAAKYVNQPVQVMASVSAPPEFESDMGVQLTQEMQHYGFGAAIDSVPVNEENDIVIQYEVKFDEPLICGGAYIKLLREEKVKAEEIMQRLENSSPYVIMFGPDKCGATDKVHFIFQHQNPLTKKWEEKHFNETVPIKGDHSMTHLYSLVLSPATNNFHLQIDGKEVSSGNLLTHMAPSVNPPKEIDDPTDHKPADWVDEETIIDEQATKPDDWDESQPRKIADPNAVKPADWLEDEPLEIPDPEAVKPEDWDDEEDGEWEAPAVPNPRCQSQGCGPWTPPLINNPLFKGKWSAPRIPNPAYVGPWRARQIPNPDYFEDGKPLLGMAPIKGLAVEVWTTSGGIHFDNFLVADKSSPAVKELTNRFRAKHSAEVQQKRTQKEQQEAELNSWQNKLNIYALEAVQFLSQNPAALATGLAGILTALLLLCCSGRRRSVKKPEEEAEEEEAEEVSAKEKEEPAQEKND
eukprot:gene7912-8729_t